MLIAGFLKNPCFGQSKLHNAEYYFEQGNIKTLASPEHNTDSLIRTCIPLFSKAIQLKPNFFQAYRNRGRLYGELKLYGNAIKDLTQAIKYCGKGDRWYLREMRGEFYYLNGQYKLAVSDLDFAIQTNGSSSYLFLTRAKAYWKLEQKYKACNDYAKAVKIDSATVKRKEFLDCSKLQ